MSSFLAAPWWEGIAALGTVLSAVATPTAICWVQYKLSQAQGRADNKLRREVESSNRRMQEDNFERDKKDRNLALCLKVLDKISVQTSEQECNLKLKLALGACDNSNDPLFTEIRSVLYAQYMKNPIIPLKNFNIYYPQDLSREKQQEVFFSTYNSIPDKVITHQNFLNELINFYGKNQPIIDAKKITFTPVFGLFNNLQRIYEIRVTFFWSEKTHIFVVKESLYEFIEAINTKISAAEIKGDKPEKDFWLAIQRGLLKQSFDILYEKKWIAFLPVTYVGLVAMLISYINRSGRELKSLHEIEHMDTAYAYANSKGLDYPYKVLCHCVENLVRLYDNCVTTYEIEPKEINDIIAQGFWTLGNIYSCDVHGKISGISTITIRDEVANKMHALAVKIQGSAQHEVEHPEFVKIRDHQRFIDGLELFNGTHKSHW